MFMNPVIAQAEGEATYAKMIEDGFTEDQARAGQQASETDTLAELNRWTLENVGLD